MPTKKQERKIFSEYKTPLKKDALASIRYNGDLAKIYESKTGLTPQAIVDKTLKEFFDELPTKAVVELLRPEK